MPSLEKKKKNLSFKNYIIVRCLTFQKVMHKLKFIDFLKIDIEGHEYKILPSIIKRIDKIGKVYCEMHGQNKSRSMGFDKDFKKWHKILNRLKTILEFLFTRSLILKSRYKSIKNMPILSCLISLTI